jgi:hypothetical protein
MIHFNSTSLRVNLRIEVSFADQIDYPFFAVIV